MLNTKQVISPYSQSSISHARETSRTDQHSGIQGIGKNQKACTRSRSGTMHLASFATYQLLLVNLNITACVSNVFTQHHPPLDNDMIRIDRSRKLLPRHTSVQSNYRALQSNHTGGLSWKSSNSRTNRTWQYPFPSFLHF